MFSSSSTSGNAGKKSHIDSSDISATVDGIIESAKRNIAQHTSGQDGGSYAEVATTTTNSLEKQTITDDAEPDILLFKDKLESLGKTDHVYKFLTLDLKPYYTAARNTVDKHTRSLARLKFLQQCLI